MQHLNDSRRELDLYTMVDRIVAENCYVLIHPTTGNALVIDPGYQTEDVCRFLEEMHATCTLVMLTHGHPDHCFGVPQLIDVSEPSIAFHSGDLPIVEHDWALEGFPWHHVDLRSSLDIKGKGSMKWMDEQINILQTPGHTPGSVSFHWDEWVFTGDTLFQFGVGRTDRPFGSWDALTHSIRSVLYKLPDNTIVYPGHGEPTSIAIERADNPTVADLILKPASH